MTRPAIHPGEIFADELQELGMRAAELARTLHLLAFNTCSADSFKSGKVRESMI
jgi:plasmid maintenance system antidote protein VapI